MLATVRCCALAASHGKEAIWYLVASMKVHLPLLWVMLSPAEDPHSFNPVPVEHCLRNSRNRSHATVLALSDISIKGSCQQ
mmetsp:Transcript_37573/g.86754  ORF Transcript_37573/g.86754 Transcript_37573/m.86754 type:complete len:81 (-) Transcript_37573:250-492(-)